MPPRSEHFALRLQAGPGAAGDDAPLAGELEAIYSGECLAFQGEAGLLVALRALRQAALAGVATAPPMAGPAAAPQGPADAAQRRTSRSP